MKSPKSRNHLLIATTVLLLFCLWLGLTSCAGTPVGQNGRLQVIGNMLCNKQGEPIQLRGMILYDVLWGGDYINTGTFSRLRDHWGCTLIRAALYTEKDGHFRAPEGIPKMKEAVAAAVDTGLYIIIDWHILYDGNPIKYKDQAIEFFREMAGLYKDVPNVLYEICSEPNGDDVTWAGVVKPYAREVITAIREIDPHNVILVGTPFWSQWVDTAADDPLQFTNIMYTCHFYAGSHYGDLRDRITAAMDKNAAVFVTEWGSTDHTGNGILYPEETYTWVDFMNEQQISWANWSLSSRPETSAVLKTTAAPDGDWKDSDLTESGLFVRSLMRGQNTDMVLFADSFESANFIAGGWETENPGIDHKNASDGETFALLNGHSSLTKRFATIPFTNIRVRFGYRTGDTVSGDIFRVEWFDGETWKAAKTLAPSNNWSTVTLELPPEAGNNYDFAVRFVSDFHGTATAGLDDVALIMDRIE